MRRPYRVWSTGLFGLSSILCFTGSNVLAAPVLPTPPTNTPPVVTPGTTAPATTPPATTTSPAKFRYPRPPQPKTPLVVNNLTLDYADATQESPQVLKSRVTVSLKDATFLAALDAVMNASDKTCRVECRQVKAQRVYLNVKDVPLAGVLDSLAKLSGARLYVLPSKLLIAPETALTEDEKNKAKLYGVLLTAATLPDTPEAKALLKPNDKGKTILDVANTKVGVSGGTILQSVLGGHIDFLRDPHGAFSTKLFVPVSEADLNTHLIVNFSGVNYADVLASFAHSVGGELYLTPEHFIICAPDQLNSPANKQWTQGAVPAFTAPSTNITYDDPSAESS